MSGIAVESPFPDSKHVAPRRSRLLIRAVLASLVILAAAAGLDGVRKIPTGPACGASLHAVAGEKGSERGSGEGDAIPAASRTGATIGLFRVGTFNIDGGRGADGRVDLQRTAATMRGCDVLGLTEVQGRKLRESRDQAQILGETLGAPWLYLPVERRWWRDDYGNALLCRLPVTHWERWPISPPGATSNRNVTLARIIVADTEVNLLVTHLGKHAEGPQELHQLFGLFRSLAKPAVLVGDLNVTASEPIIQQFLQDRAADVTDVIGRLPAEKRRGHVDWILVRGLACVDVGTGGEGVSDHPFYWADLRLPTP